MSDDQDGLDVDIDLGARRGGRGATDIGDDY